MKAIVYQSKTGHSKQYAEMLGEKLGLPVYTVNESESALNEKDDVVYIGWLMGGMVSGYDKVRNRLDVKVLCGVGMTEQSAEQRVKETIVKAYGIAPEGVFYLLGGYAPEKLRGISKFMLKLIAKSAIKKIEEKPEKTAEELQTLDMMKNGRSFVSEEKLAPVLAWCRNA